MTFRRAGLAFALQHLQGVDDSGTGVLRFDDQIDHTSHRSLIWCGKVVDVFLSFGFYIRVVFEMILAAPVGPITLPPQLARL